MVTFTMQRMLLQLKLTFVILDGGRSSYAAAVAAAKEYYSKLSRTTAYVEKQSLTVKMNNFNEVAQYLAEIARTQLIEAIKQGNAGLTMAYHQCGAPITLDLLALGLPKFKGQHANCRLSRD